MNPFRQVFIFLYGERKKPLYELVALLEVRNYKDRNVTGRDVNAEAATIFMTCHL
jgi:hypothetical protein